jgi:hypothetical protein
MKRQTENSGSALVVKMSGKKNGLYIIFEVFFAMALMVFAFKWQFSVDNTCFLLAYIPSSNV